MHEPRTRDEWQEAADAADACLAIHAALAYGLITGGPEIDVDRCEQLLERARAKGIRPRPDALDRQLAGLLARDRPRGQVGQPHMPSPYGD